MSDRPVHLIETPADLVQLVMTQHWDMAACPCTFCEAGRAMGLHPHEGFLQWRSQGYDELVPRSRTSAAIFRSSPAPTGEDRSPAFGIANAECTQHRNRLGSGGVR